MEKQDEPHPQAEREGYSAGRRMAGIAECPYRVGTEEYEAWLRGYREGHGNFA